MKRTIITLVLCTLAQIIGFEIIEVPDVIKLPSLSAIMVLIASTIEDRWYGSRNTTADGRR